MADKKSIGLSDTVRTESKQGASDAPQKPDALNIPKTARGIRRRRESPEQRRRRENGYLVRDQPRQTYYLHAKVLETLEAIHKIDGTPYNTLNLRALDLLFAQYGYPSIKEITGEDPSEW